MWERISKDKTCIRRQVGESEAIRESEKKVKKGKVFENLNAKNKYNRSNVPDPDNEPPTESELKTEGRIKKEILRLKKLSKSRNTDVKDEARDDRSRTHAPADPNPP